MAENPLSGDELFERGKAHMSEIHAAVESGQTYYLGLSPHEPPLLLSKIFNPESGPIIRLLLQDQINEGFVLYVADRAKGKREMQKLSTAPLPGRKENGKESRQRKG